MKTSWLLIIPWLAACSGTSTSDGGSAVPNFYNLDSLLEKQIGSLANASVEVEKTVVIDQQSETNTFVFDEDDWKEELNPVRDLNLNLPIYTGAIDVLQTGNTLRYVPKPGEDLNITYVEYGFDQEGKLASLVGKFSDIKARKIYATERIISLRFENNNLVSYRVSGYQKMVSRDTTYFDVFGVIKW